MKAETADYLAKAGAALANAERIAAVRLPHVATREAYYAAYHAAEAYILDQTGKVAITDRGVRGEFGRLAGREPRIDRELTRFLATASQLKATANCGIGPTAAPISADQATAAITTARRFIEHHHPIAAARLDAATRPERAALTPRRCFTIQDLRADDLRPNFKYKRSRGTMVDGTD
jgi:uncharacterized protein (UPF0332 family)